MLPCRIPEVIPAVFQYVISGQCHQHHFLLKLVQLVIVLNCFTQH